MNPTLQQQASQSAQQGQRMLSEDQATAASSKNDYTNYSNQANQANQQLQGEASYMQGAGSGENVYNRELGTLQTQSGYNPQQLSDANKTLFNLTGAANSANSQFNTPGGVGAYGVSAPALASYEGSILNPLTTGVNTANTEVGALNAELGTFETGASQATTGQVQSEQNVVTALTQAAQNYQTQASAALQNMQFYNDLASKQGGLNAQEQQSYAAAEQAYAQATQAIAQSKYILSQTTGQNILNQASQNQLNKPAPPTPNKAPSAPVGSAIPSPSRNPSLINSILSGNGQTAHDSVVNQAKQWGGNVLNRLDSNFDSIFGQTGSRKVSR
jgi:hypothetical protein